MEKVFIMGDSYSTFEGYIPKGYEFYYNTYDGVRATCTSVDYTWWKVFAKKTNSEILMNDSYSGSTVCCTVREGKSVDTAFVKRIDKYILDGFFSKNHVDKFIIFGGTNDSWINCPLGEIKYDNITEKDLYDFFPAYIYLINRIKEVDKNIEIIVVVNCNIKEEVIKGVQEICKHLLVKCVTLNNIEKQSGHPNDRGMEQIANQIISQTKNEGIV